MSGIIPGIIPVYTPEAAPPAGPYSQAIKAAGLVFVSGQIPADTTGAIIEGDITAYATQCLRNMSAILEAAGSCRSKVIKTTIFLSDMNDFAAVNDVYKQYFSSEVKPARSTVAVKTLPANVKVEMECIALQ